jgi:hypothetical protein
LLVVFVLAVPVAAAALCPLNTVYCIGKSSDGVEQFNQTETSTDPTHSVGVNASSASYDLVNGSLSAVVNVDDVYLHHSGATAVDVFELHNAAGALIKVRLTLSLFLITDPSGRMAWADGYAKLTIGGQSVDASSLGPNIDPFIELDVAVVEGEAFTITYETSARASGYYPSASMSCQLEFVGIPAGAWITSCNGFNSGTVPVEPRTWGRIKALYR